ncbi:hypothetical protein TNCV_3804631 [Trichonephila clavipes]|nr:hypothetical protein TNCV_3804631 [Trichonephila clavipes]
MFAVHRIIGGAKTCGFQSSLNDAMDALRTFHSAANGVEGYERTPNDCRVGAKGGQAGSLPGAATLRGSNLALKLNSL